MSLRTVFTALEEAAERYGELPALYQPGGPGDQGKYRVYSWAEYKRAAEEIAAGLRRLGIGKGDVIALDSETRAEFYLADLGIMANGSIAAALYGSYPTPDLVRTIRACGARAVFVQDPKTLDSLKEAGDTPLSVQWILLTGESEGIFTLEQLRDEGRRAIQANAGLLTTIRNEVGSSDHAILYLTSGATGEPKMALTTHAALVANMEMGPSVLALGPQDATVAFLPSAHIAQRVVVELLPISCGMPVWFAESLVRLPQTLKSVRPTAFLAPPRFWERVYASACTEIQKRSPIVRRLFHGALGLGLKAKRREEQGKAVPRWMRAALKLADRLMFRKLRERFGGRVKIAISGAAPLGKDLARFYEVIGFPLVEGYGLTEGGIVSLNPLDRSKAGSIGKPLPGLEVRLADDGELLVRGPCLFAGYFRDPQATAGVFRDGWLYTGDTADIDDEGYIYITGRKKEVIISSSGRKIYPARIESLFKLEPIVNHVVLVGDRLPYVTALLTVNTTVAESLRGMENMRDQSVAEIAGAPQVVTEVSRAVARVNRQLAPFEQIRKFRILDRDFTIIDGELTATMKIRRSRVVQNYRETIAELYAGSGRSGVEAG